MKQIKIPDFSVSEVYDECIDKFYKKRKDHFLSKKDQIILDSINYENMSKKGKVYEIKQNQNAGFKKGELENFYKNRLGNTKVKNKYRQLLLSNDNLHFCPYCGIGTIYTLDHILPKKNYPNLSVTPTNLVPACQDCNKNKLDMAPTKELQSINLYFDDLNSFRWLFVKFEINIQGDLLYEFDILEKHQLSNPLLYDNIKVLFDKLDLAKKYYYLAASDYDNIITPVLNCTNYETEENRNMFWKLISKSCSSYIENQGMNYYKSAFLFYLLKNQVLFTKYIKNKK